MAVLSIIKGVSDERAEIVRRQWEAYNRGDMETFLEVIDPECEFHEDPAFPEAGVYRGPEEIKAYISQFRESMAEHSFEVEEVREFGDKVLSLLHERARGRTSGVDVSLRPAFVYRFRNGKVVWVRAYLDRAQALIDAKPSNN